MRLIKSAHPPVEEVIHGTVVRDPYRWLEDRSLPQTQEWVRTQQANCDAYFARCEDIDKIRRRVREYLEVEIVDQPARIGDRYFFRRRDKNQEQGLIYVRDAGVDRVLVDPASEGPLVSIGIHRISRSGSLLAYEHRCGGEDRKSIHVVDVKTGIILSDALERGFARGLEFTPGDDGYFYCHETSPVSRDHTIRFHLFDRPAADQIVFRADRSRVSRLVLTGDSVHIGAIWVREAAGEELLEDLWIARKTDPTDWQQVCSKRPLPFSPILRYGRIFALTQGGSSDWKLVELDLAGNEIRTIVPEQEGVLRQLGFGDNRVCASFLHKTTFVLRSWPLDGREPSDIAVPEHGTISLLPALGGESSFFASFESFANPPVLLEYVSERDQLTPWHGRTTISGVKIDRIREDVFVSNDGLEVPITLISATATRRPSPVIMTGYGGFGVPTTPQFSVLIALMLELGCSFVLPHIRGGGEFGRAWHEAARGRNKHVAFDDFVSAAEWLCQEEITTPQQLAIFGGSNAGLLVAAAMTKRPSLFKAVLCIAPLLDMVRYEHFEGTARWRREYGTVEDPEDFAALYGYSPYHSIHEHAEYPATMFVAGDRDDRCDAAHVRKMAAYLQVLHRQQRPILVDYSEQRGHSPHLPLSIRVESLTRRIAFLCHELDLRAHFGGSE